MPTSTAMSMGLGAAERHDGSPEDRLILERRRVAMRANRWLTEVLLGLGVIGITGLAVAQQDRDGSGRAAGGADESQQLEPINQLQSLEHSAAARSSPISQRPSG